jgi:hypothetical protein
MAMSNVNQVIRRFSNAIDTSGAEHPVELPMSFGRQTGGVYVAATDAVDDATSLIQGRISLGLIAVLIVGSVGFYYYTRSIQGGG